MGNHQLVHIQPRRGSSLPSQAGPLDHQRPASVQGSVSCLSDHTTTWRVGSKGIPEPAKVQRQVVNAMCTQVDGLGPQEAFDQGAGSVYTPKPERYSPASSKYPHCDILELPARETKELLPAPWTSPGQSPVLHLLSTPHQPCDFFLTLPRHPTLTNLSEKEVGWGGAGRRGRGDGRGDNSTREGPLEEPERAKPVILQLIY